MTCSSSKKNLLCLFKTMELVNCCRNGTLRIDNENITPSDEATSKLLFSFFNKKKKKSNSKTNILNLNTSNTFNNNSTAANIGTNKDSFYSSIIILEQPQAQPQAQYQAQPQAQLQAQPQAQYQAQAQLQTQLQTQPQTQPFQQQFEEIGNQGDDDDDVRSLRANSIVSSVYEPPVNYVSDDDDSDY